jgi:hypothetical protein
VQAPAVVVRCLFQSAPDGIKAETISIKRREADGRTGPDEGTMTGISADKVDALSAVLRRLKQVDAHWHEALAVYFEPDRFRVAMQNCITVARTVSFILQSHKAAIPEFERWYGPWTARFAADPVMRWAVLARNKIEKQGDLETQSQMRSELIAAYAGNPVTNWTAASVAWSSEQVRRSIPARLLDPHVIESGVLSIERRWVDSALPEFEVLDALAHVYGQLALMLVDLHRHLDVAIPEENPNLGHHLLRHLLADGRLPSMERPLEERAVYIAVKDGAFLGYRYEFGRIDSATRRKAERRYRHKEAARLLTEASTLLDIANAQFAMARTIMLRDHHHATMFIPLLGIQPLDLIIAPPRNRADKYMLVRDIARYVRRIGADGLIRISEAWTANWDDIPRGGFAEDAPNRGESLTLAAVNSAGEQISLSAEIERKRIKKRKVKRLGPTEIEMNGRVVSMAPVLEVWGRLDALRLDEKDEWEDRMMRHFGHEKMGEAQNS